MTVITVDKDFDRLTLTLVARFDAPVERVWQMWADPRLLERWWGPPTHPSTVERHELTPGGEVTYYMTGPDGTKSRGWWRFTSVEPPRSLEFIDGFADQDGNPITDTSITNVQVRLTDHDGGTRMEVLSAFSSLEHMEQVVRLGAVEAFVRSVEQMDALLRS